MRGFLLHAANVLSGIADEFSTGIGPGVSEGGEVMGEFDCIVFKHGQVPFIHPVSSTNQPFNIEFPDRETYESFTIDRIEEPEEGSGKLALYLVANKTQVERSEISRQIKLLKPRPVKYFK